VTDSDEIFSGKDQTAADFAAIVIAGLKPLGAK
jgi:hypothetical protein